MNKEEQDYFEQERVERERRTDAEDERNFWQQVFFMAYEQRAAVASAAQQADLALATYRERFQ